MRRIQEIIALIRDDHGGHRQDSRCAALCPTRADVLGLFCRDRAGPLCRQIRFFDRSDRNALRNSSPNENHVCRKFGAVCEHLQSAERSLGPAVHQRRSLVVPTTTGKPSALAIVCGVFCPANPVDRQLPDTVFHLRKNVVYAGHALGSAEDGDRCRVVQRGDRCFEPSKSCILVTQNFRGPGDRLRQFLGVCLFSRDKVCHNERTPGNPNIQLPEGA